MLAVLGKPAEVDCASTSTQNYVLSMCKYRYDLKTLFTAGGIHGSEVQILLFDTGVQHH